MSAHVVPKAQPFPDEEDEEKTTIESGWEEEASTTVEQGEVADKIRALGSEQSPITPHRQQQATGVTSTGASQLDEPTVDDQNASSAIAAIAAIVSQQLARLSITQGNDIGQEIEIRPGKSYTIGRAIDNDVVLTDIAVSRKHFDLRFQDGAWVIVDRGSGNGTVVNGNVEDNPFMLASGDTIEIGNTVFRFEQPNGSPRTISSFDVEVDDEELSTVAGKPLRNELPDPELPPRMERPKTLPPPTPIRPRSPSSFPAVQPQAFAAQPASTMPLPQMAGRAPLAAQPQAPTLLATDPVSAPIPGMMPASYSQPMPVARAPLMAGYPQYADLPASQGLGPLMIAPNGQRLDPSSHAPPPYGVNPMLATPRAGQLSHRAKLILGAAGLALLAGITTIAIVKSGGGKAKAAAAGTGSAALAKGSASAASAIPNPPKQVAVVTPIAPPVQDVPKQDPPKQIVTPVAPPKQDPPKKDPPKQIVTPPPHQETVKKDPPRREVVRREPLRQEPRQEPKKDPPRRVAAIDPAEARTKADALYRQKRFSEAASTLQAAAKGADESDAKELRHTADLYVRVQRGLSSGTAPAARPEDAFSTLRSTANYDRAAGGAFSTEIENALSKVAPKAASAYLGDKNYEGARSAVIVADQYGANTSIFKMALDRAAADLYSQASKEAGSDPASAREKCQRILNFADSKSPWYQKAAKLKSTL